MCVFLDYLLLNSSGTAKNHGLLHRSPFRMLLCSYETLRAHAYPLNFKGQLCGS